MIRTLDAPSLALSNGTFACARITLIDFLGSEGGLPRTGSLREWDVLTRGTRCSDRRSEWPVLCHRLDLEPNGIPPAKIQDIEVALGQPDTVAIEQAAHSLKGAAADLCAPNDMAASRSKNRGTPVHPGGNPILLLELERASQKLGEVLRGRIRSIILQ